MSGFRHEAFLYEGEHEFLDVVVPFLSEGAECGEPAMVAVDAAKIERLQQELGPAAEAVRFVDMAALGRNPSRIIPAWREFAEEHSGNGTHVRGIDEPVWPGRGPAELVECRHHESLLNLAFADAAAFTLLCPYDTASLDPEAVATAWHTHPHVFEADDARMSDIYLAPAVTGMPDDPLPAPPGETRRLDFGPGDLSALRRFVSDLGRVAGMAPQRTLDLAFAVSELASNSVRHGGGGGVARGWVEESVVVFEVADAGTISDPLAGRKRPTPIQASGRGLWLVNQFCDLVQIRSGADGTVVRVHQGAH